MWVFIIDNINRSIFRCLSTLYQDPDWSQKDLQDAIRRAQSTVSSSKAGAFSPEQLKYYFQELNAMEITGRKVSFTDLWGLIVEYFLQQKVKILDVYCCVFQVGTLPTHVFRVKKPNTLHRQCCRINTLSSLVKNF